MEESFFEYKKTKVHYVKIGNAPRILLAFHGFGQDHTIFSGFMPHLKREYTIYIFDLFFHGKSEWNHGESPLEKSFWTDWLAEFLKQHQIERFNLLGFSMGGKFALASLESFPDRVDNLFLLAPDGIIISPWYWLATYPIVFRKLFKNMITKSGRFQYIANLAYKSGLINGGMLRFVEAQMSTEEKRKQVYLSWVVFRHLKFKMNTIASIISSKNINLTVVVGKHDRIVKPRDMQKLLKHVHRYELVTPETGHTGIFKEWKMS
jgi:pimeloyl-ACP methyl ester carboxylesterase